MDSTRMDSLQEYLDLLLAQSSLYREEGKNHIRKNDLVAARLCYTEALNYVVANFVNLKDHLLKGGFDINLSDCISREIAMIFGNRSLVMLKEGDIGMAIQDAQQSLDYFPTAKGYFRLAEARCCAGYFMDALQLFSESYSLENNTVTYCKYFVLAVYIGHHTIILEPLDSYTPVIERLITLHEFRVIHLEILLLPKCKAVPKLKTGIAINKCSTACIKNLSEIMMETGWKLVDALIEHGTVPDIKCIEVATEKYGEDRTLYLTQCIEEKTKHNNICYNSLLSKAIRKKWNDRFVHHCLERGAKFAAEDVWTVLKKWSHDSRKHNLLKLIVSQDGAMDIQNDKGQLPLDFLLEQGMFNVALLLLEFKIDCSGIDIIKTIKSVKKYNANRHPIFKILDGIIENKKQPPDLLIQELTSALKYAFTNNRYDVAAMLIDHGADISSCVENSTTVHVATKIVLHVNGRIGILKNVLDSYSFPENGKVIDKDGQLPHHLAVADNTAQSEAVLKLLFQYSAKFDLKTKNKDGNTALSCCRRKREHLKKLLEAEIDRQSMILKSSGDNIKDNFQQQKQDDKQGTKSKSTEPAAKESSESHLKPLENETKDDGDDETKLSMHELTELVKRKVDSVLRSDHRLQEISEYGHKLKEEPLKIAKGMPSDAAVTVTENTSRKEKEKTKEKKRFEECTWEVECTETFWKELCKQEKPLKEMAFSKLHRLANGEWHEKFHKPLSGTKCKKLYELKVDDSVRIIWERAIAYSPRLSLKDSSQNKPAELYTEVIRIWSLVIKHDNISTHVKHIETANKKGEDSVIKKKLSNHSKFRRERIPCIYGTDPANNNDNREYFPPASAKDNEYNVVTFYSVSEGFIESILQHKDSRRDFPFKGWPKENEIINLSMDNSVLLLGRSGTGKTTCCLYRLWNQFKLYWEADTDPRIQRISLIKPKPTTSIPMEASENELEGTSIDINKPGDEEKGSIDTPEVCTGETEIPKLEFDDDVDSWFESDSCDDVTSEDDEVSESDFKMHIVFDHLQQVFITKNSVLCAQFKKKFYDMAYTAECLEGHLEFEKIPYPNTLQNLDPRAFPLFLTTHQWLYLLDASLEDNKQFFPRKYDGSLAVSIFDIDDTSDAFTENLVMLDESSSEDEEDYSDKGHTIKQRSPTSAGGKLWKKVDSTYFCEVLWQKVAKGICNSKKISPLLVWIEIKSFIKGSFQALQNDDGFLSFNEYCNLGHKMAPNFVGNREMIYKLFERYEIIKKQMQHRHFDDGDLVFNLFQRLSKLDDINWCIHQFYIDEVQDFTQAELTLLLHCCRWPNGLFLTGDTAQSIMRGVSFRFSDLRSVFHYISKHVDRSRGQKVKLRVPQLHTLTQNFRSHSGILQLAASVIDLLMHFFRSSLDKLPRDQGMFPGPKPVLLSCDFNDLVLLLKGNRREASAIEFGARQAIIVQSEETKKDLSNKIKAIVLTVFESKGLEFDDVLLYNFFSDSKVTEEWKAVINYLDENAKLIVNHEKLHKPRPLRQFNECEHKALNSELKFLYTAITRARCNLWIYDSDPDKRAPMFYYFQKIDLVRVLLPKADSDKKGIEHMDHLMFTKVSTPEEWKRQGDYFRLRKIWETAILCYEKAGIIELVNETKGDYNMWMAQKENQKQHYLQATLNYLRDFDIKPSVKRINKAATCLYNACKYEFSAALFLKIHEVDNAVKAYVKNSQYEKAASLYKETNQTEKAIKVLLLDKQGKLLPNALQLAMEYTNTEPDVPLEIGCSVNEVAQRTAHYYLQKGKTGKAIDCVDHFSEVKDKVSFLKTASSKVPELIDEAINVLFKAKQYNDFYHLLKGKEKFERGKEIAGKLQNDRVCCEFLLLSVKKKLLKVDEYTKEDKVKEANMLEEACKKLHHNDLTLTLQVELICGILNEEPQACFNVCKKLINNVNHFGAIEALNAAFCLKEPNLDIDKIIVIVNCLQIAYKIINEIKSSAKLSLQHLQHCRKFYLFEQSEARFFLPPHQFYWIPALKNKHLPEPDSDGMVQFDALTTYKILEQHLTRIAHEWLQLDLEKHLYNMMISEGYSSLKCLDIQSFTKKCYKMSDYLICCIKLIEISHCHLGNNSIKSCDVGGKIHDWKDLSVYASSRILDIFSPQWRYFLKISESDIEIIKKSKITCDCLRKMLHSGNDVANDINIFLRNWRILKLTGSDISTLINCLQNEEAKLVSKLESKEVKSDQTNPGFKDEKRSELAKSEVAPADEQKEQKSNGRQESKNEKLVKSEESSTTIEKSKESSSMKYEQSNEESKECLQDKEKLKDTKENIKKPNNVREKQNAAIFIKTESGYSHSFFTWLDSCAHLENGNFMGFAEGVIKRLLILIAKRKSFNPKITVMNITSVLEVLCIGLFASLKAAARHAYKTNLLILFPKFYEHFVTSYDPINFTSHAFLDLVTTSVEKSENLRQLYDSCLHLLQRILQLLLGNIEPSFNVLYHAALRSVSNHGFERCLVLCLSLLGNLWPLLHRVQQVNLLHMYETMRVVLDSQSQNIEKNSPQLFAIIRGISKIKDTKNIFTMLLNIHESNQSYTVNLQYQIESGLFSFDKIRSHQFPTYEFKSSKHIASNAKKLSQGQPHQLQHHKKSNTSIPKSQQQLPASPAEKPMSYTEAVKQSTSEAIPTCSSTQLDASEMSHEGQISESHPNHEISDTEKENIPVTNSELSPHFSESLQCNDAVATVHTPLLTGYTVPMLSTSRVTPNILGNLRELELTNQSTLDNPQHKLDGSAESDDEKTILSHGNVEQCEATVDQTRVFHDDTTNAELQPLFTMAAYSDLPVSHSGTDVETAAADSHQLQHALNFAESQNAVIENTVPFQSRLKPDAESFIPAGTSASSSSVNPRQVQELTLQTMHSPSNIYQPASTFSQEPFFPAAAYGINTIPQPQPVQYYPVIGQYMSTYAMPDPFLYGQPTYQSLYPSVPWPYIPMDNVPTAPYANQEDVELEDFNYYSSGTTRNEYVEASGDENMSNLPNNCHACGHMHGFEDEKSKAEHYASPEHLKNTELYSAYQATIKKYAKDVDDARKIIESANTYTGTSHPVHLIRTQIVKIKEWKNRFDREIGQIEDKFDWSTGQSEIEHHINELNRLKERYEKLKTFKLQ